MMSSGKKRFSAVATVRDVGAAQVAQEALGEAGIPVEIKPLGAHPYFGSVTIAQFEVRVPEERLREAEAALEQLAEQAEAVLLSQEGVPPAAAGAVGFETAGAPRYKRLLWAIVLSLLLPFPAGCLYAGAYRIAATLLGFYLVVGLWFLQSGSFRHLFDLIMVVKVIDLALVPISVNAYNRRLFYASTVAEDPHAQP